MIHLTPGAAAKAWTCVRCVDVGENSWDLPFCGHIGMMISLVRIMGYKQHYWDINGYNDDGESVTAMGNPSNGGLKCF